MDGVEALLSSGLPDDAALVTATSAQRGLWITQLLDTASTAYHIGHAYELRGPLDLAALEYALESLFARHEILRTGFAELDTELYQVIYPQVPDRLAVTALAAEKTGELPAPVLDELNRPFDLGRPPLLRAHVFVRSEQLHILVLVAHHLILDAQSVDLLWTDLARGYGEATEGGWPEQPAAQLQFADYAEWEREYLTSAAYEADLAFFREQLRAIPAAIDFPLPPKNKPAWTGGVERMLLSATTSAALLDLARSRQVTPFTLLLTLFAAVLRRWTAQPAIVIGTPASIRSEPGLEDAAGMFINSVPLPTRWDGDPTFLTALAGVRDMSLACLTRQRCPFDQLIADLKPAREPRRSPVFQVLYAHANAMVAPPHLAGLSVSELALPLDTAKLELSLDTSMTGDRIQCDLEWSAQRFDQPAAALFLDHLRIAADYVAQDPQAPIGQWPLGHTPLQGPEMARLISASHDPEPGQAYEGQEQPMSGEETDDRLYTVVRNEEEQYSIWFADRDLPAGWISCGVTGPRQTCLDHIESVWTDMRPASLRAWAQAQQGNG